VVGTHWLHIVTSVGSTLGEGYDVVHSGATRVAAYDTGFALHRSAGFAVFGCVVRSHSGATIRVMVRHMLHCTSRSSMRMWSAPSQLHSSMCVPFYGCRGWTGHLSVPLFHPIGVSLFGWTRVDSFCNPPSLLFYVVYGFLYGLLSALVAVVSYVSGGLWVESVLCPPVY